MTIIQVLNHVLSEIQPSFNEKQKLNLLASEVKARINKSIKNNKVKAEVIIGGSFSRGTYLRGTHDIDLFIRFKQEDELTLLKKIVLDEFPEAELIKASRDYYQVIYKEVLIQFIPTILIDSPLKAKNSMDASCFHVEYLNTRLNDAMRNEVLLLKQFCKATGVYGAESYINGFSGYVIELLIIHFGSFIKFLEFINKSKGRMFIDMEGYYDSINKALTITKTNKSLNPVIIIDPVIATRNAAAGLNTESFNKFILNARLFLIKPSTSFFKIKERTLTDIQSLASLRGHHLITHQFNVEEKKDVQLAKLKKAVNKIKNLIEKKEFKVYDYGVTNNGLVYFELEQLIIPLIKKVIGPPVTINQDNFEAFINKKAINGPYVVNGRICFDVEREENKIKPLLLRLLREIRL